MCLAALNGRANQMFAFINVIAEGLFLLQLSFACSPAFYVNVGKSYEHINHSHPHVYGITRNILIAITIFDHYYLLPASLTAFS